MKRTAQQSKLLHAIFDDFARSYPEWSGVQWKAFLVSLFPAFLAEADGDAIPAPTQRESTAKMDASRCAELIECCLWLGAVTGVAFSHDCN